MISGVWGHVTNKHLAGIPETEILLNTQSYVRLHCLPVALTTYANRTSQNDSAYLKSAFLIRLLWDATLRMNQPKGEMQMKDIEIGPIRPPSESESLLIRVTRGCHWNKCYFCGLYKSMKFSMRPIEETITDIKRQARLYQGKKFKSCFLQDGDALVLKSDYLLRILDALNKYFP